MPIWRKALVPLIATLGIQLTAVVLLYTPLTANAFLPTKGSRGRRHQPQQRIRRKQRSAVGTTPEEWNRKVSEAAKIGQWEELHGNYLLRPSVSAGPPRALIHFLGGAIVGTSPHVSYRFLLETLAADGYLVVATPYLLSFDHLATCDAVIARFERIAGQLAQTYGALPVVGLGHSCGALLQVLLTSLFPDTPRAANALLSYNNKPVGEAVPLFEEIVTPFFTYVAALNDTNRPSGSEILRVGLTLAQSTAIGHLPPDQTLTQALDLLKLSGVVQGANQTFPPEIRHAYEKLSAPSIAALANGGVLPLTLEALRTLEQIPSLVDEVAGGMRDFVPPPSQVREAARRAYRARRTLILRYRDDPLDESIELEEVLAAAGKISAMKRPVMDAVGIRMKDLPGGHAAPLLAPPLDAATRVEDIFGAKTAAETFRYEEAAATARELLKWLEEENL